VELVLAAVLGLVIGGVVGAVGGGGAILALPVLVYVLDQGATPATTAALIVVAIGASFGAGAQAREGNLAFVPLMLIAAAATFARAGNVLPAAEEDGGCPRPRLPAVGASGLGVGALTGFFGVGGGFVIVPTLTMLLDMPMRRAIATSLAIITFTGLAALASHLAAGAKPNWSLTMLLAAAAAVGALAGSRIGRRLRPATLAQAFGAIVAVIALLLLVDVLLLGGPPTGHA
jgi:uncharacterized membrane protein YfcA